VSGGPMYYMKKRLNINLKDGRIIKTGKYLGIFFAVATVLSSFGTGNLPQINSIANSISATFGLKNIITGGILAVLLAIVIIGGIKRIAKVTERLVPGMAVIYFLGAILVIGFNIENLIPSIVSIFSDVFTGTAAVGGFMGAGFSYAFNRGVNRGLFSNEAGQGSAPIAHAAARTKEPVSEGLVAILEPFIDTIIICTLTGLVILSSGVWKEKFDNTFQMADVIVLDEKYDQDNPEDVKKLRKSLSRKHPVGLFSGDIDIAGGQLQNDITILHARSFADSVKFFLDGKPYSGSLLIDGGAIAGENPSVEITGSSLIHSAPLTAEAFKRSWIGESGKFIISIGLLLFAFSTAISWSYYGGRAMTFLFGSKSVLYYRIVYVIGFFLASFTDTSIIWTLSGITIAFMTIPNLIGIFSLRKEVKSTIADYWKNFSKEHPDIDIPENIRD